MMKYNPAKPQARQEGFSLIEAMIAIVVLTVGILAVIASLTFAMAAVENGENDLIARQKAQEAIESIYTARNSQQPGFTFASINNVSNGGIFTDGPTPLYCAGTDGMIGTTDDVPCKTASGTLCPGNGAECMVLPGPDGVLGTPDDTTMSLSSFTRTITITQVKLATGAFNQNLVAVTVTIAYPRNGGGMNSYTTNALVSSFF